VVAVTLAVASAADTVVGWFSGGGAQRTFGVFEPPRSSTMSNAAKATECRLPPATTAAKPSAAVLLRGMLCTEKKPAQASTVSTNVPASRPA